MKINPLDILLPQIQNAYDFREVLLLLEREIPLESMTVEMTTQIEKFLSHVPEEERVYRFGNEKSLSLLMRLCKVLEIKRISSQQNVKFRSLCASEMVRQFTSIRIIYKDEDEDWLNMMPLWESRQFTGLKIIEMKAYPLSEEEKALLRKNKAHFPALEMITLDTKNLPLDA